MAKKEFVTITYEGLNLLTVLNSNTVSELNHFSKKGVFFSPNFKPSKSNLFQALGNLGAFVREKDLDKDVSMIVISDHLMTQLSEGQSHIFFNDIENKLNQNNSPYRRITYITETQLINYLEQRFKGKGDDYSLKLLSNYKKEMENITLF